MSDQNKKEQNKENPQEEFNVEDVWAWTGLVIIVLLAGGILLYGAGKKVSKTKSPQKDRQGSATSTLQGAPTSTPPATTTQSTSSQKTGNTQTNQEITTSSIQDQLEGINVEEVEKEFQKIEEDLQKLQTATGTGA
ncbi:MAG: hypothetical protein ABEI53_02505 [Candidatus Magasanikbacteria bacterium]